MAQRIPLANLQSQRFTVTLDGDIYTLRIKAVPAGLICDISINEEVILQGHRIVGGSPLIPYTYLERGNFIFVSSVANAEPDYRQFNETQNLYYLSPSEIAP